MLQVLRCLRVDRVTVGITRYVIAKLGERYVQPPVLDYASIYMQSTEMTPIVFVLSPGADPAFDIFKLGAVLLQAHLRALVSNAVVPMLTSPCRRGTGFQAWCQVEVHGFGPGHGPSSCRGAGGWCSSGAVGYAAELPSAAQMAEDFRKDLGAC